MKRKTKGRRVLAFIVSIAMAMGMFSSTAFAATPVPASNDIIYLGGNGADDSNNGTDGAPVATLEKALELAGEGGQIILAGNVSSDTAITVDKTVVLDLNGNTLTKTGRAITATASMTVQDSKTNGKIAGTSNPVVNIASGGTLILNSGTIEANSNYAAVRVNSNGTLDMQGGAIMQKGSGTYNLQANGGTVSITGGRIEGGSRAVYVSGNAAVTIGLSPAGTEQTAEEAGKVYISNLYPGGKNVILNSGIIGGVTGSFGTGSIFGCWFESDISDVLPAGTKCVPVDGTYWKVTNLTAADAAAEVDGVYYASLPKAAQAVQNGQTLKLLKDYTGESAIEVKAYQAVIDLNGYSITNTKSGGTGLAIKPAYGTAKPEDGFYQVTVRNSGQKESSITAEIPLATNSGNSRYYLPIILDETVSLTATGGKSCISLGTSSYINYTDRNAGYISNGGFKATHEDGKEYIHGTFASAVANDVNSEALLLNDYTSTSDYIAVSNAGTVTLDLGGHTFAVSNQSAAIRVQHNDASLIVKNGSIISDQGGAWVGIGPSSGQYHNASLIMEDVDLTAKGEECYGIVCNGSSTGIHISLKGGSVSALKGMGIYFPPADSTLTIDGTEVTGETGIAVKGGTVTIQGNAKISGTGASNPPQEGVQSGVNNTGDALYVEGNYSDRTVQVKVVDGTFTSTNGKALQMLFVENNDGEEKEIAVSGGTFSSAIEDDYIVPGADIQQNGDGSITVVPPQKFTITYKTNAGVEMGTVEYIVGESSNAFPQTSEFGTLFRDFLVKAQAKGDVSVAPEDSRWYQDQSFTQSAVFPQGEDGQNYTVYCKLTTGLFLDEISNGAENVSYRTVHGPIQPHLHAAWGATNSRNDQYEATVAVFEKNMNGVWVPVDESYYTDYNGTEWTNMVYFSNVSDSGTYRLKYLYYTATDADGNVLYYDYAYDTEDAVYEVKINPVELTIAGVQALDRSCDGSDQVALTGGALEGVIFQDEVSFVLGNGTMVDKYAGTDKAVATNIQLTGAKAGNYTLVQPADLTVNVSCSASRVEEKPATCTEAGYRAHWYCPNCDRYYLDQALTQVVTLEEISIPMTEHQYSDDWSSDDTGHWHACACGAKADFASHTSDDGVITTAATETTDGVKTYTCTVCGKVLKTEVIPATGTGGNSSTAPDQKPDDTENPQTGDSGIPYLWGSLLLVSCVGIVGMAVVRGRKKHCEK